MAPQPVFANGPKSRAGGITGQFGTGGRFRKLFSYRAVLTSLDQSENCTILDVKQRAAFTGFGALDYPGRTIEDEQCQRIGGGDKAVKFRFLLFL